MLNMLHYLDKLGQYVVLASTWRAHASACCSKPISAILQVTSLDATGSQQPNLVMASPAPDVVGGAEPRQRHRPPDVVWEGGPPTPHGNTYMEQADSS